MPAIWNSYSKSDTARSPRMITFAPTDWAKFTNRLSKGAHLDALGIAVFEMSDLVADDLDPFVGREERPLAVVAGDADDQPVDDLDRPPNDVRMSVGDRIEGAGIDPDARLGHVVPLVGLLVFCGIVRTVRFVAVLLGDLRKPRHRDDPLALADLEDHHPLAAPARDADVVDRAADHHPAIGHQHDLVVVPDREDGDDRIAAAAQIHVVDALSAAPGDPVVVGRAPDAEALLGHAQHELLALSEIGIGLFRDRAFVAGGLAFGLLRFGRRLGGGLVLLADLPPSPRREAQIGVAHIGGDLLVAQDRQRDHLVVAEQSNAADADRGAAGKDPHIADREADRLTVAGGEQHIVGVGTGGDGDQPVIGVLTLELHRDLAVGTDIAEIAQGIASDIAICRREHRRRDRSSSPRPRATASPSRSSRRVRGWAAG